MNSDTVLKGGRLQCMSPLQLMTRSRRLTRWLDVGLAAIMWPSVHCHLQAGALSARHQAVRVASQAAINSDGERPVMWHVLAGVCRLRKVLWGAVLEVGHPLHSRHVCGGQGSSCMCQRQQQCCTVAGRRVECLDSSSIHFAQHAPLKSSRTLHTCPPPGPGQHRGAGAHLGR